MAPDFPMNNYITEVYPRVIAFRKLHNAKLKNWKQVTVERFIFLQRTWHPLTPSKYRQNVDDKVSCIAHKMYRSVLLPMKTIMDCFLFDKKLLQEPILIIFQEGTSKIWRNFDWFPNNSPSSVRACHNCSKRSGVTWALRVSPASRLVVEQFVRTNNEQKINASPYCVFLRAAMESSHYRVSNVDNVPMSWRQPEDIRLEVN